jgi:hypothetical protein
MVTFLVPRFRFWYQQPSETDCSRCCGGNAEKSNCVTEISNDKTKESGAERRANTRERPDKALGQIESTRAICEISNDQSGQYAQGAAADAVE